MSHTRIHIVKFPQPCNVINLNDRLHWRARAALTAEWRKASYFGACAWRAHPSERRLSGLCSITVTFPTKQPNRRRDPHNWMPSTKAIVDGLTDAGLWPDDNAEYVSVRDAKFAAIEHVEVSIEEQVTTLGGDMADLYGHEA
jgi:crossover junction endodeoxyribonuclease RusA